MPGKTSKGYDVAKCQEWCDENRRQKKPRGSLADRLELAEVRKAEHDAAIKRLKSKMLAGKLIEKAPVLDGISRMFIRIRDRLQAIGEEVSTELPSEIRDQMRERIDDKVSLVLVEMSQWRLEG